MSLAIYRLAALVVAALVQAAPSIVERQGLSSGQYPAQELLVCQGKYYSNPCITWTIMDGQCMEVPVQYNDNIASIYPTSNWPNTLCTVYADPYCSGTSLSFGSPGIQDIVGTVGAFGSNGVTNILCTSVPGTTPSETVLAHMVYYCKDLSGPCTTQLAQDSTCTEIPSSAGYNGQVIAFLPAEGTYCQLYTGYLCGGREYTATAFTTITPNQGFLTFRCFTGSP